MEPVLLQVVGLDEVYQKGNVYRASFDHLCEYKTLEAGGKFRGVPKPTEEGCWPTISMSENVISILTRLATTRKPRPVEYGEMDGSGLWKGGLHGDTSSDQAGHEAAMRERAAAHGGGDSWSIRNPPGRPLRQGPAVAGCAAPA